jgi:hypothetical protein
MWGQDVQRVVRLHGPNEEMIRAYDALLARLRQAGSNPRKHVLDNEVSDNMKHHIQVTCKLNMELVPPET